MNTDTSQETRVRRLRSRTLANFHRLNPTRAEGGNRTFTAEEQTERIVGQSDGVCCITCVPPGPVSDLQSVDLISGIDGYSIGANITWNGVPNATSYQVIVTDLSGSGLATLTGPTSASVYWNNGDASVTVNAISTCGISSASIDIVPCFLAGSLVQMADATTKKIEDVLVGDELLGAFGEINRVLALHRPLVGAALMCNINGNHHTTNHHPHVSSDKQFYCGNPSLVENNTYGHTHTVYDETGTAIQMKLHGLQKGRVKKLELGIRLKTVEGERVVETLETYSLPPETQLYNLVTSGSHTYYVDGYAVTGWPREDDFDYDLWQPRHN